MEGDIEEPEVLDDPAATAEMTEAADRDDPPWFEAPCVQRYRVRGEELWVPIPCNEHWIDTGDPPPDAVRARESERGNPSPVRQEEEIGASRP